MADKSEAEPVSKNKAGHSALGRDRYHREVDALDYIIPEGQFSQHDDREANRPRDHYQGRRPPDFRDRRRLHSTVQEERHGRHTEPYYRSGDHWQDRPGPSRGDRRESWGQRKGDHRDGGPRYQETGRYDHSLRPQSQRTERSFSEFRRRSRSRERELGSSLRQGQIADRPSARELARSDFERSQARQYHEIEPRRGWRGRDQFLPMNRNNGQQKEMKGGDKWGHDLYDELSKEGPPKEKDPLDLLTW